MSDGDDDPQLQSLRAVWLSLPDEEPSQTGMAQLMAAARVKAEQMAKPSLWHRAIEMLRRPSVLALATIVVLIGGVVFVGRRGQLDAVPTAAPDVSRAERQGALRQDPDPAVGAGSAAIVGAPGQPGNKGEVPFAAPEPPPAAPARHLPVAKSATTKPRADHAEDRRAPMEPSGGGEVSGISNAAPPKSDPVLDKVRVGGQTDGEKLDGRPLQATPTLATDEPSVEATSRNDAPLQKDAAKQPAIAQLLAQCRSAATRGDCAAVRLIAQRIAKQNAAFYRERVSKDITLTKCLAAE